MKLRIALATATALGLCMGVVYANDSDISQAGNNNSAVVNQSDGENNGSSIIQTGDRNDADVLQVNSDNSVGNARQAAGPDATGTTNILTIIQSGLGGNEVTSASQTNLSNGSANTATIKQGVNNVPNTVGGNNTVGVLSQDGAGNQAAINQGQYFHGGNSIGSATQAGQGNNILTVQDGSFSLASGGGNAIVSIDQSGKWNNARIEQRGSNNGQGNWGGIFADAVLLPQGTVKQNGDGANGSGNYVFHNSADGNDNQFAYSQDGYRNQAYTYQYDSTNEIAVLQWGGSNVSNNVQDGGSDDAGISVNGNVNTTNIRQYDGLNQASISVGWGTSGAASLLNDNNAVDISQTGGSNGAHVDIDGSRNLANAVQLGGSGNAFQLSITGDDNNKAPAFTTGGDAASVSGLTIGLFRQDGADNIFNIDISGNSNQIASLQSGNGNSINGAINGSFNEAAISQSGGGNYSFSSQTGSYNNIGVSQ